MTDFKAMGYTDAESRLLELLESISPTDQFIVPLFALVQSDEDADEIYNAIKESEITDPDDILEAFFGEVLGAKNSANE